MIKYNKAIRDNIPGIIEKTGEKCVVTQLPDVEFLTALEAKLMEELSEYYSNRSVSELVDLLEVIYRIAEMRGVSQPQLEQLQASKRALRGGFTKNLFLWEVSGTPVSDK